MLVKPSYIALAVALCVAQAQAGSFNDLVVQSAPAVAEVKPATWASSTIIRDPNGAIIGTETSSGTKAPAAVTSGADADKATPIPTLPFTPPPKPANAVTGISTIMRAPNGTVIGTQVTYFDKDGKAITPATSKALDAAASDGDKATPIPTVPFTPPPKPANAVSGISTPIYGPNHTVIGTSVTYFDKDGKPIPAATSKIPDAAAADADKATPMPSSAFTPPPKPANAVTGISTPVYGPDGKTIGVSVTYFDKDGKAIPTDASSATKTPEPAAASNADKATPIPTVPFTPPPKPANAVYGISTPIYGPDGKTIGAAVTYFDKDRKPIPPATSKTPDAAASDGDKATPIPTVPFTPPPKPANAVSGISTPIYGPDGKIIGSSVTYFDKDGKAIPTETSKTPGAAASDADKATPMPSSAFTPPPKPANAVTGISTPIYGPDGKTIGAAVTYFDKDGKAIPTEPKSADAATPTSASSTIIRDQDGNIIGTETSSGTKAPDA